MLPDLIDGNAGGDGIGLVKEPVGEIEAIRRCPRGPCFQIVENGGNSGGDRLAAAGVISPDMDKTFAAFLHPLGQGLHPARGFCRHLCEMMIDRETQITPGRVDAAMEGGDEFPLSFRALTRLDFKHRTHRRGDG